MQELSGASILNEARRRLRCLGIRSHEQRIEAIILCWIRNAKGSQQILILESAISKAAQQISRPNGTESLIRETFDNREPDFPTRKNVKCVKPEIMIGNRGQEIREQLLLRHKHLTVL